MKPGFYCTVCGGVIKEQRIDDEPVYENCWCGQFLYGKHPDDIVYEEDEREEE